MSKKPGKTKGLIPALMAGGGFFAVFSLIFGTFRGGLHWLPFLLGLGLSAGLAALVKIMASGLDLTTHNREDAKTNEIKEAIGQTGKPETDVLLQSGLEILDRICEESRAIANDSLSESVKLLKERCTDIFRAIAQKPERAPQIRKLVSYYLPTTLKMLTAYRELEDKGLTQEQLADSRKRIADTLALVADGCQKALNKLHQGDLLDMTTDMDVLEQMLKRDGLSESELDQIARQTKEAARLNEEALRKARERNAAIASEAHSATAQAKMQAK